MTTMLQVVQKFSGHWASFNSKYIKENDNQKLAYIN